MEGLSRKKERKTLIYVDNSVIYNTRDFSFHI